jgi:dihydroneopterin aldolase
MTGTLFIKDLVLRCIIGINAEEKASKQDEIVNITMWVDFKTALQTDSIENAINYALIYEKILSLADKEEFDLQETLAKRIADICLADKRVLKVKVSCEKPHIFKFSKSAGVELEIKQS